MAHFDDKKIQEAAYYIWQSKGCPMNSSASDWSEAIEQLERQDALAMAGTVSSLYSKCTLIPTLNVNLKKAAIKSAPFLCVKSFASAAKLSNVKKPAAKKAAANSAAVKKVAAAAKTIAVKKVASKACAAKKASKKK